MAFQVEADVEVYGWLSSDDEGLLSKVVEHDWLKPFPVMDQSVVAVWEPGKLR